MTAEPSGGRSDRFHALSGFRFLLAAHILAFHFAPVGRGSWPGRLLAGGYVATSTLFVLSGFILASVYPDPLSREGRRRFWVARFARLYPAYLLAWALCLLAFLARIPDLSGGEITQRAAAGLLSLALVQAWSPELAQIWNTAGWATSALAFFYAVFPFAMTRLAALSSRALAGCAAALWLAGLLVPAMTLAAAPEAWTVGPGSGGLAMTALNYDPLLRAPEFLFGCTVGLLHRRGALRASARTAFVGLALLYAPLLLGGLPYVLLHNGLLAPAAAFVLVGLASGAGPLARGLSSRPLVALGEAGFAVYVLQFPLYGAASHLAARAGWDMTSGRAFGAFAVATLATAFAVSRWLEAPARRALRRAFGLDGLPAAPSIAERSTGLQCTLAGAPSVPLARPSWSPAAEGTKPAAAR